MIFPMPLKEEYGKDYYYLKETKWENSLIDFFGKIKYGNSDIIFKKCLGFCEEEYEIIVDASGIIICYSTEVGKFRASTSLRQMLQDGEALAYCKIRDKPQFERRAYMLDISRCMMPKMKMLVWWIDLLADLKYNELQLYMDSFCYKYEAFPKYTQGFDCLTSEDIEYLDQYCADRFIDLVPNQNSLGHLATWLEQPEFAHLGLTDGKEAATTLNPLLDESIEFMDKLYSSLLPHFRSKYVSIGLDEAYGLGRFQTKEACEKYGKANVFMDYLNRISEVCEKKYGKTVMFWSDMIKNYPESHARIPKNAVALNWGYDLILTQMAEEGCRDLKKLNIPYYVCPGNATWLSFTGRFDVMSFNTRTMGELGRKYGAKGYLMTDWGCGEGHMHFMVWGLVPCALAGQYGWNVGVPQNGENMRKDFIYASEQYIDKNVFHAEVSRLLYRMQQYYLLEPERMHNGTICCYIFRQKLSKITVPGYDGFPDLKKCGDDFYFDNVIAYMKKCLKDLDKVEFDDQWKREIKVNAEMVILATELLKIRMNQRVSLELRDYLSDFIDRISNEYKTLWCLRNYEKGVEDFLGQLKERKRELYEMVMLE